MKKFKSLSLVLALMMVVNILVGGAFVSKAAEAVNSLTVSGKGSVTVKADAAKITLGVKTESKTAEVAQKANAKSMDAVLKAIKAIKGIDEKDIQTLSYSIYPRYNYVEKVGRSEINGYEVNNSIQVDVKDVDLVGKVLDIAVKNGINVTNSLKYYVQDQEEYYLQALEQAAAQAQKKAGRLAKAFKLTLGNPKNIEEVSSYRAPVFRGEAMVMKSMAADYNYIETQEIDINAEVRVTY